MEDIMSYSYKIVVDSCCELPEELLKDETQKVKDVGAMVGYESSAHFVSIFRKKFGMTPNEYRRKILEGKNTVQKRNEKNI